MPSEIDTINGQIIGPHDTKEYRFKNFARDRTVVSARLFTYATEWLRFDLDGAFVLEQKPKSMNLFHAGMSLQVNY